MPTTEQRAAYNRTYYEKGGKAKIKAANQARRERNREFVRQSKLGRPCLDCGGSFPFYVMEYDHIGDDKLDSVGSLANQCVSLERLQAEIAKCELVCANCHRERTWLRSQPNMGH